jgi:hypothetical protein
MKVRVLWVPPSERNLIPGRVYDLADGDHLVKSGDAEKVKADVEAEADPRPQPEAEEAPAVEAE